MAKELETRTQFIFYEGEDGKTNISVIADPNSETIWTTQKGMSEIFRVEINTISYHLKEIYLAEELSALATIRKIRTVQQEGRRDVNRLIEYYNLDVIISVGYRVNSIQATRFRIWATQVLREFMVKGFALDDDRLKQGGQVFGRDYFAELLERIREIRSSERLFWQKITDIFAQCSIDYDSKSSAAQLFYATVQNKMHWAIHGHTASELIVERVDSKKPYMGLTTWKGQKIGNKILKLDVSIAKNYLSEKELKELNTVVSMYLDFAESMASRRKGMTMADWAERLNAFLNFNEYEVLQNAGKVSTEAAKQIAETEYTKYRVIQDKEYKSDFDKVVSDIKTIGKLPNIRIKRNDKDMIIDMSRFNKALAKTLKEPPKEDGSNKD